MNIKVVSAVFLGCLMAVSSVSAAEWNEHKDVHFIVYYKDAPQDFIKSVEQMSENYYHEIANNLGFTRYKGWLWNKQVIIYIYHDATDYVQSSQQYQWSHGAASAKERTIRTFPSAHGFFDSTLPHELGHIIFREFIGFQARIPLWFEEGVAMYQEKAKRWGAHDAVRQAIEDGNFIPLAELNKVQLDNNSNPKLVNLFYAESASILYYMIHELGEQRFVNFCKKLEAGETFESGLHAVYVRFRNLNDLNKSWVNYLKR